MRSAAYYLLLGWIGAALNLYGDLRVTDFGYWLIAIPVLAIPWIRPED